MIEFNGKSYSGAIIREDDDELVAVINAIETLQDLCVILTDVKTVTETLIDGTQNTHAVNNARQITATGKNCYTVTFSKRLSILEEMNQAIDSLLVLALGGDLNA